MIEWFILKNGEKHGPVTASALKILAANGTLRPDDKVWREGLKDWKTAGKVVGLFPIKSSNQGTASSPKLPADGCPEIITVDPAGKSDEDKALPKEGESDYISKFLRTFADPNRIEQTLNAFSTKYSGTDASGSNESESGLKKRENQVPVKYAALGCLAFIAIIVLVVVGISLLVTDHKPSLTIPNVADNGELSAFEDTPPPVQEAHKLGYKVLFLENIPEKALMSDALYCISDKEGNVLVIQKMHLKDNQKGNQAGWADSNFLADMKRKMAPHMNVNDEWSLEERGASVFVLVHKSAMHDDKIRSEDRFTFTIDTAASTWKLDHAKHNEAKGLEAENTASTIGTGKASWLR